MKEVGKPAAATSPPAEEPPFADSLCHRCAAPPRFVRTARSVFIYCPVLKRYPPQPVRACPEFVAMAGSVSEPE